MNPERFSTHSLRDPRLLRVLAAALQAADPAACVRNYLVSHRLPAAGSIYGLALGKAAVPMLDALNGETTLAAGLAVTKHATARREGLVAVIEGGHPVPDARSLEAGRSVLEFAARAGPDDTLVVLISGGASALAAAPHPGIELADLRVLTTMLLQSGARIEEVNTLRRHLDRLKGGGLLRATKAGRTIALILSDVTGNALESIGSGPTAPDPSNRADALEIIRRYSLEAQLPASITAALRSAPETLKVGEAELARVQNVIVGDNSLALQAARIQAVQEGFAVEIITASLEGEAAHVGRELGSRLAQLSREAVRPTCLLAGGETTVTFEAPESGPAPPWGRGGRNQELALAAVPELAGATNAMLITLATDGNDGPTDAAGAVVTGQSAARGEALGLRHGEFLHRHDSYAFFEPLGDLLKPGYTATNVNDLVLLCAFGRGPGQTAY